MCARSFYVALATLITAAASAASTPIEYTIDPLRSTVTVLGALASDSFQPLTLGSSTARYVGSIFGELDGDLLTLEGVGADALSPGDIGDPERPPAYDLVADTLPGDAFLWIESISFSGSSDSRSEGFSISSGVFPGHHVRFFIGGGTMMFFAPGFIDPTMIDLHGRGAPNTTQRQGTIVTEGGIQTITIPIDMAVPFSLREENDTILTFSGQLVATAPVPEPGPGLLAGVGVLVVFTRRRSATLLNGA